jgi:hypothetical protein
MEFEAEDQDDMVMKDIASKFLQAETRGLQAEILDLSTRI